ncbi:hypothetical protein ACFT2C_25935 [Promicromonospora sp. NPDC057138]|uniref:hypothetical protein n=1 Tax=Promicromonospora sp. NPDC057138 TaxID=3346031 RepID=UPI003630B4B2
MNCDLLPRTGPDVDLGLILIIAIACLVAGAVLLLAAARGRRRGATAVVAVLLMGTVVVLGPGSAATAATTDCDSSDNSLTVTQTSTMEGLAPGVAPAPITGRVVNNGTDSAYVAAVAVEITHVTAEPGAPAGACSAADYRVIDTTMTVGKTLGPGGSAPFAGASIGFADQATDQATDQDACQRATVHLLYTANPGGSG